MQGRNVRHYLKLAADMAPGQVRKAEVGGRVVWIKKASRSKIRIWHKMQYLCSCVFLNPIIRSTVSAGGPKSLAAEALRIAAVAAAGFHVPDILGQGEDFMVLSDAGAELKSYLSGLGDEGQEKRHALLEQASVALAQLHEAGFVHGRPHLKDMVYDESRDVVGFIDLEEDPLAVMPPAHAQSRDIWLFLCSSMRYLKVEPERMDALYKTYLRTRSIKPLRPLRRLTKLLAPFCWIVRRLAYERVGKDVRHVILVNERLGRF